MALNRSDTWRDESVTPTRESTPHTTQETFFLERLARMNRKSVLLGRYLIPTDRRMQLLNRALLSTYEDCRTLGVGEEARVLLESREVAG